MSKYLKVLFVAMFAMGLFTSAASDASVITGCGAAVTAGNLGCVNSLNAVGNSTIATELVGSTTAYSTPNSLFFGFNSSNAFNLNDIITFTISGATITDGTIGLCGNASNTAQGYQKIGSLLSAPSTTDGVATLQFRFDNASGSSGVPTPQLWPSANASTATCVLGPTVGGHALSMKFPASTAAGTSVTVASSGATGGGTAMTGATVAATTQFTVRDQFIQTIATDTAAIDFATGRVKIIPNTATTAVFLDQTTANVWATAINGPITIAYTQTTADKLDIVLSGSMTGISRICWNDAACTASSTTKFTISTTANTATYSVAYVSAIGDFDSKITFVVDGTTILSPRTFTVTTTNNAGSGVVLDRTLISSGTTLYTLTLASYQAVIPYISANSTYKTICFINNGYSLAAPAVVDILTTESVSSLTSLANLSIGTVAVNGTNRVDFDANITPYSYASGVETAGTPVALGFNAADRYSAMLTVNGAKANVTVNCIQVDPAGSKRAVPVLTSGGDWNQ